MRRRFASLGLVGAFAVCLSTTASASTIIVDADAFAAGTNLDSAFAGVTLSSSGPNVDGSVYSESSVEASTGTNVFGSSSPFSPTWLDPFELFRADFATAATFVSLDFIATAFTSSGELRVFGPGNVLLTTLSTGDFGPDGSVQTLSFSAASIAYVTATGPGGDEINLDHLVFETTTTAPVPEPASLTLLGLGLAGMGARRWRQRKA